MFTNLVKTQEHKAHLKLLVKMKKEKQLRKILHNKIVAQEKLRRLVKEQKEASAKALLEVKKAAAKHAKELHEAEARAKLLLQKIKQKKQTLETARKHTLRLKHIQRKARALARVQALQKARMEKRLKKQEAELLKAKAKTQALQAIVNKLNK